MKIGEKLYRFTVLVLCVILIFTILPTAKRFYNLKHAQMNSNVIVNTKVNGNVETTNTIDNTVLKVKYTKATDKYSLYRDDIEYNLTTTKYSNNLVVDLGEAEPLDYDGVVIGQCPLAIPLILWTPALIEAAQVAIAATVAVVGTYTIWYSVDSIAQTIDNAKVDTKAETKVLEKEDTKKNTAYYAAALAGGKVVISRKINYAEAVARLVAGKDVFATNKEAAKTAALAATTPTTKLIYHSAHDGEEGFYPHYHPGGRQWIVNKNYLPHCWYGSTP